MKNKKKMPASSQAPTASPWIERFRTHTMDLPCTAAIIATAVVITVFFVLKAKPTRQEPEPFCCPNEARLLNTAVNRSLDPCYSFYNYVCLNTIKYRLWPFWDAKTTFKESIATGTNLQNNSAAVFLSSVFKSCVRTIWRTRPFIAELADTIADMANLKSVMTLSEVFLYLLVTNVKYNFPSVVHIDFPVTEEYEMRAHLHTVNQSSPLYENYQMAITAAAITFNTKFGTNISLNEVYNFENFLQNRIEEASQILNPLVERELPQWMTLEFWKDAFRRAGWITLTTITKLDIEDPVAVEALLDAIGQKQHHQAALIYLLAHTTVFAFRSFRAKITGHYPQKPAFDRCFQTVDEFINLKDYMYTVLLTSTVKERHMTELFTLIMGAMKSDILSRSSLDKQDIAHLLGALQKFSLVVPSQRLLNITVPTPSVIFSRDYCQGYDYEFGANELRLQSPYRFYIHLGTSLSMFGNKYMIPSPAFFKFYSFNEAHSAFLNMASIGVKISAFLWYSLLRMTSYREEMVKKLDLFFECFKNRYYGGRRMGDEENFGVVRALALTTVLRAMNRSYWNDVKVAWSYWKLSSSQLFYLRESFHLCPVRTGEFTEENSNVPLSYSQDFVSSFKCSNKSRMSRVAECKF